MSRTTNETPGDDHDSRLLKAVESIAISSRDAKSMGQKYMAQARRKNSKVSDDILMEIAAKRIVARYCKLASTSGGVTSLTGVIPGLGTVAAILGGSLTDAAICMKLQVDMCMCIAAVYEWDLDTEDARHLAFLIAAGGTLEKAGTEVATQIGSKAGVSMLRQYLKGAALQVLKQFFRRIGIIFTRKALEKALPFGVGVAFSAGANYVMTKYVGGVAIRWFVLDREQGQEDVA